MVNVLKHYRPEWVLAEMRRTFWIIHGREAIRKYQRKCTTCRKWRAKPEAPKMADLPSARLRLFKPAFYSTGIDCFGPLIVKVARRLEKRLGILYKCLTTRAVYLDIVEKMDTDSFLMSLRRIISRHGKPYELLCDGGTNFRGGQRELEEAWFAMTPSLIQQLAKQKICFRFNPPSAPHFGGALEREIKCIKDGLKVTLGDQSVTEPVLQTVFAEVEGILNSKPLGYVSSDVRDIDPITPNVLLMGRLDQSLPQGVYPASEIIGRRRWRHRQILSDHFWKRYLRRYLPEMQSGSKWVTDKKDQKDIDCNDVVMIVDQQSVGATWLVGRVSKIHPSCHGRVRVATVTVGDRDITRPVTRLIRLPRCPDDDD
ncbi:uncharacterized protein LOC124285075 [Haliotis rubra]|uniref:uncharacterized protein LOC124285075 n=1 Tax=Haliotis rubra TaxID=36100 RepID=UPI001EE5C002|nr:uncharacterized protein LOC124285075 [Haliotis rubra]